MSRPEHESERDSEKPRGRPRSNLAHQAILEATRDLLTSGGYERLSIEAIAARAGVGKQTIYRRWRSKSAVVAEVVLAGYLPIHAGTPADTGDVLVDLQAWVREQVAWHTYPGAVALVRGLAAAAADSDADAGRLYDQLTGPVREGLMHRLAVGVQQSQLRADADLEAATDAIIGSLLFRVLARSDTSSVNTDSIVEIVIGGIGKRWRNPAGPPAGWAVPPDAP